MGSRKRKSEETDRRIVKLVGIEKTKRKGKENTAMKSNGIGKKNINKSTSYAHISGRVLLTFLSWVGRILFCVQTHSIFSLGGTPQ